MQQMLNAQVWPVGLFEEDHAPNPEPQKAMGSRLSRLKRSFMTRSSRGASAASPSTSSTLAVRSNLDMGPTLDVPSSAFGGGSGAAQEPALGINSLHLATCSARLFVAAEPLIPHACIPPQSFLKPLQPGLPARDCSMACASEWVLPVATWPATHQFA